MYDTFIKIYFISCITTLSVRNIPEIDTKCFFFFFKVGYSTIGKRALGKLLGLLGHFIRRTAEHALASGEK